jgi:hypothetical protein
MSLPDPMPGLARTELRDAAIAWPAPAGRSPQARIRIRLAIAGAATPRVPARAEIMLLVKPLDQQP